MNTVCEYIGEVSSLLSFLGSLISNWQIFSECILDCVTRDRYTWWSAKMAKNSGQDGRGRKQECSVCGGKMAPLCGRSPPVCDTYADSQHEPPVTCRMGRYMTEERTGKLQEYFIHSHLHYEDSKQGRSFIACLIVCQSWGAAGKMYITFTCMAVHVMYGWLKSSGDYSLIEGVSKRGSPSMTSLCPNKAYGRRWSSSL